MPIVAKIVIGVLPVLLFAGVAAAGGGRLQAGPAPMRFRTVEPALFEELTVRKKGPRPKGVAGMLVSEVSLVGIVPAHALAGGVEAVREDIRARVPLARQGSPEEVAEVMGLPDNTVKSHLFRARKALKDHLLAHARAEDLLP